MPVHENLLGGPPPTYLPEDTEAESILAESGPAAAATRHPAFSLAWALLAEQALERESVLEAYAYARTGYHRGLDALRRSGWKGHGPIPWEHGPNTGFLRCLAALARACEAIAETDEADRSWTFLSDSSEEAYAALR
jgi:hypothetical protein